MWKSAVIYTRSWHLIFHNNNRNKSHAPITDTQMRYAFLLVNTRTNQVIGSNHVRRLPIGWHLQQLLDADWLKIVCECDWRAWANTWLTLLSLFFAMNRRYTAAATTDVIQRAHDAAVKVTTTRVTSFTPTASRFPTRRSDKLGTCGLSEITNKHLINIPGYAFFFMCFDEFTLI